MVAEIKTERSVPSKLSVAILAYRGNLADYIDTKVLLVTKRDGRSGPVAGKIEVTNHIPENPLNALKREWDEETGSEPFKFKRPPTFKDTVFAQGEGFVDIGFIYHAVLTDNAEEVFLGGKKIDNDEDIVEARLFDIDEVLVILRDWRNKLTRPEINAQTLINVVNNVMVNHDDYLGLSVKGSDLFDFKYFDMNFKVTSLNLGTS